MKGLTTDNASNMKAAAQMVVARYPHIIALGCNAHQIALLVSDLFKSSIALSSAFEQVKVVARYFKSHPTATAILQEEALKIGHNAKVI